MRGQAGAAMQRLRYAKRGVVSAYDPNTYLVKVQFPFDDGAQPETGWIPLGALAVGKQFGIYAPPSINDQVLVVFQDGALEAGIAIQCIFDDISPPLPVPSGEMWAVHAKGQVFKLTNDGRATFMDGHGASVVLNGDGTMTSAGTWTHQGKLTVQKDFTVQGNTAVAAIKSNSHDIGSTHQHINSGGSGLGGVPQ
ncbi:hypothetical protein EO087_00290 [Dyella sp. M7H15-1]|uniref:phage baseplate assembly protein V n=1 Tax=Dyella sp. M7H15-1 TaxID=2501295 RepID=UPI00100525AD|nr:phage baseplate assembly protein V [Dyella sp. M7H15-1]QAU22604.1 hypothetical protein EO087_00290 [Dyella sp. M7H15-1]